MTPEKLEAFREVLAVGLISAGFIYLVLLLATLLFGFWTIKIMQGCALVAIVFGVLITITSLFDPFMDSSNIRRQTSLILIAAVCYLVAAALDHDIFDRYR